MKFAICFFVLLLSLTACSDPGEEAKRLAAEARQTYDLAMKADDTGERLDHLKATRQSLNTIIETYPQTDVALALLGGDAVAGMALPLIEEKIESTQMLICFDSPFCLASTGYGEMQAAAANYGTTVSYGTYELPVEELLSSSKIFASAMAVLEGEKTIEELSKDLSSYDKARRNLLIYDISYALVMTDNKEAAQLASDLLDLEITENDPGQTASSDGRASGSVFDENSNDSPAMRITKKLLAVNLRRATEGEEEARKLLEEARKEFDELKPSSVSRGSLKADIIRAYLSLGMLDQAKQLAASIAEENARLRSEVDIAIALHENGEEQAAREIFEEASNHLRDTKYRQDYLSLDYEVLLLARKVIDGYIAIGNISSARKIFRLADSKGMSLSDFGVSFLADYAVALSNSGHRTAADQIFTELQQQILTDRDDDFHLDLMELAEKQIESGDKQGAAVTMGFIDDEFMRAYVKVPLALAVLKSNSEAVREDAPEDS